VGGDLYDFILEGGRLWLLVGDVSGKGVGAALFMAVTRTLFRAVAPGATGLRAVAERMNDELARDNDRAMFVTAFLACLELATGRLEYVNAGHNLPYRLPPAGNPAAITGGRGLPFGVFEKQAYATDSLTLGAGDGLFVFTDGVVEATDAAGEAFGDGRLEAGLLGLREAPSSLIVEQTLAALDAFVGQAPAADDVTLLALRYSIPPRGHPAQ
jgi:sigma-B regulation protein RsbU (phosphoserine phosphatase)